MVDNYINFKNSPLIVVTKKLLKLFKIGISASEVEEVLLNHSDFNSMLSLSDALQNWNVDNMTIKIPKDSFNKIWELSIPFVAFLPEKTGEFVLVTKINQQTITYFSGFTNKYEVESVSHFKRKWSGIALLILKEKATIKDIFSYYLFFLKADVFKKIDFFILIIFSIVIAFSFNSSIFYLLIIKVIGFYLGWELIKQYFRESNSIVSHICRIGNTDCGGVLQSSEAKFLNLISFGELVFIYYAGGVSIIIFQPSPLHSTLIGPLAIVNFIACLFTFLSIYYQAFKLKRWCLLCAFIIILVWVEFYFIMNLEMSFSNYSVFLFFVLFGGFLIVLISTKGILEKVQDYNKQRYQLKFLKKSKEIFQYLLKKNPLIYKANNPPGILISGKTNADIKLTLVTKPNCPACALLYRQAKSILQEENDLISLNIVFPVSNISNQSFEYEFVECIYMNYIKFGKSKALRALIDWYSEDFNSYESWRNAFKVNASSEETKYISSSLLDQYNWCRKNGVSKVPRVVLNGYYVPEIYNLLDLNYFFTSFMPDPE